MPERKAYIIAVHPGSEVPSEFWERLARIEGVSVTGRSARRAQFTATPEVAEKVRAELSSVSRIEEAVERKPA
jgi:hypothetical protein